MHDASINLSSSKLIINCSVLFLGAAAIQILYTILKLKEKQTVFLTNYLISLASVGLLALAINKPCDFINGGHYMFIDLLATVISYLLKIIAYITLVIMLYRTFVDFKTRKRIEARQRAK